MKKVLTIGILILLISLFSGCFKEAPQYKSYIMYGYFEDWDFYNDTNVNGFIFTIDNVSWNNGDTTQLKEHWFSDIPYSPIEMDYFVGHNISIHYISNYYEGWDENVRWTTIINEIKNLEVR